MAKLSMMFVALVMVLSFSAVGFAYGQAGQNCGTTDLSYQGRVISIDITHGNKIVVSGNQGDKTFEVPRSAIGQLGLDENVVVGYYYLRNGQLVASCVSATNPTVARNEYYDGY